MIRDGELIRYLSETVQNISETDPGNIMTTALMVKVKMDVAQEVLGADPVWEPVSGEGGDDAPRLAATDRSEYVTPEFGPEELFLAREIGKGRELCWNCDGVRPEFPRYVLGEPV